MAYFNPQPISFNPSPEIMKGASAIGDTMQKLYLQNYQDQQSQKAFEMQQQTYNLQKQKYDTELQKVQSEAQDAYHSNVGKSVFVEQNDPKTFAELSKLYGNDTNGFIKALAGVSSKIATPKEPQGTFKTDPNGNLYHIQSNGTVSNLGFKTALEGQGSRTTNEITNYQQYADSLKRQGATVPSFAEFYDSKMNSKQFGVGMRDYDETQNRISGVAIKHGLQPEKLSSVDFSKLSPAAQYDFGQIVGAIEQTQKDKIPDWTKKEMVNLSQVVHASGDIAKLLNANDSGMLDRAYNKVNQFLGLGSDAEMARQSMSESAYALYRNHQLKIMSGTAVSASEEGRSIEAFGELWRNDQSVASKMFENMSSLKSRLQAIKDSYNPIAFNYRYGNLERGVDASMKTMWSAMQGNQPQQQAQPVASSRGQVIQMLQQKGATPQQIDIYLQQKGL